MPWRDACTPYFEGRAAGNSPLGGCRGDGENARSVTAIRQVAGAHLAYRFLNFKAKSFLLYCRFLTKIMIVIDPHKVMKAAPPITALEGDMD